MREFREEKKCPGSKWTKYLSEPGHIRVTCVHALLLTQELARQHSLDSISARELGEAALGALLVSSLHDDGEDINVKIETVRGRSIIDARPEGVVRGFYVPKAEDKAKATGALAVLYTRQSQGKVPYQGVVELKSERIDENLDHYFSKSEQIPTSVAILVETAGERIVRASGVLVQIIGGASLLEIADVLSLDKEKLRAIAKQIADGEDPLKSLNRLFSGRHFKITDERDLCLFCNCTQEKVERALKMTGERTEKATKVVCDFCRREYIVDLTKLRSESLNQAS